MTAAYYQCQSCQSLVGFVNCQCGAQSTVLLEGGRWPRQFRCFNCGQIYPIIPPGGTPADKLVRVGKGLEEVGKAIQGIVGSVILLGLIFVAYQCLQETGTI